MPPKKTAAKKTKKSVQVEPHSNSPQTPSDYEEGSDEIPLGASAPVPYQDSGESSEGEPSVEPLQIENEKKKQKKKKEKKPRNPSVDSKCKNAESEAESTDAELCGPAFQLANIEKKEDSKKGKKEAKKKVVDTQRTRELKLLTRLLSDKYSSLLN